MKRCLSVLLLTLVVVVTANSQTFRGAINGTVTDPSGAAVAGATVKATESATGLDHSTNTSTEGQFSIQDIPLGFYKVSIAATGFPTNTVDKVEVVAGTIYTLNVQPKLGPSSKTVEICAAPITWDTTTSALTMSIKIEAVQNTQLTVLN